MNKNIIIGIIVAVALLVIGWSIYASMSNNVKQTKVEVQSQAPVMNDQANMIAMIVKSPSGNGMSVAECPSDTAKFVRTLIGEFTATGMPARAVISHLDRLGYAVMRPDSGVANPHGGMSMPGDAAGANPHAGMSSQHTMPPDTGAANPHAGMSNPHKK